MMSPIPRIVIAGTHSGCGKTTVASGIMAALVSRGFRVQPFKVGPDFIDPSHHTLICGRASRNLDPFMMGEDRCRETFARAAMGADIAVIEGVMGMFDGLDGSDLASTAHVARILDAPVILVTDVKGMSRSVHALIKGFMEFDPSVTITGVIHNRVGSPRHRDMLASSATVRNLGWIPRDNTLGVSSRHLGLVMAHESAAMKSAGTIVEEYADLDAVIAAARAAPRFEISLNARPEPEKDVRIGIARDNAFCFYYADNLDFLEDAGAELVFFSPLSDHLPDVDAVYIGGGYPELHLATLESAPCTGELKSAALHGLPIYGECGGLMYLAREVRHESPYRMTGILPASAEMTKTIQALGYVKGCVTNSSFLLAKDLLFSGHEFHYSRILPDTDVQYAMELSRGKGIGSGKDGIISGNALGCYTHLYFSQSFAQRFVDVARHYCQTRVP